MEIIWLIVGVVIVVRVRGIIVIVDIEMGKKIFDFVLVGWKEREEKVALVSRREVEGGRGGIGHNEGKDCVALVGNGIRGRN